MIQVKNHFIYNPGGVNEGSTAPLDNEHKKDNAEDTAKPKEEESLVDKIKDALQDWSNDDKRETEFDDTFPVT
jgi:hypothetical protein